ncbi:MAG: hypothetical protein CMO80_07765 [Verrucomicrobiales bacterium]|nr:hypothetical protein [Verrucomicrobiales bacterium]|tara:strand:+ start:1046 stop:1990 length:945 start_codon:yes stop_codon:yes gene_type:complete
MNSSKARSSERKFAHSFFRGIRAGLLTSAATIIAVAVSAAEKQITFDGKGKRDPMFIKEGRELVYSVDTNPYYIQMVSLAMDTKDAKPVALHEEGTRHQMCMSFSPDERHIAYVQCTGNLMGRLIIRDQEAKKDFTIKHSGRGSYRAPTFSPDGKRVVYAFAETGPQQLWSVNLEAGDKKQLTETEGITNWPTFTPDGKRIVFANSRENNYEIYSMDLDGKNEKRLTKNGMMDIRPRVSPDGEQICFVSTRDGNYEVYVMNIDGTNTRRITNNDERDDFPSWHPNSRQLVFVSERRGRRDLYLIDVDPPKVASN